MFDYLQQFNSLPKDLRDKVSSAEVMSTLAELEKKYKVDLAMVVMKVMIKRLSIKDLPSFFIGELNLSPDKAKELAKEMEEKVFSSVADYVGISSSEKVYNLEEDIDSIVKESGIAMPNSELLSRLKKILSTYIKGVRSRIDTRDALTKKVEVGGLGLSDEEANRLFKVCDSKKFKSDKTETVTPPPNSQRLDEIISQNKKGKDFGAGEYDLKAAIASRKEQESDDSDNAKKELEGYLNEGGDKKGEVDDLSAKTGLEKKAEKQQDEDVEKKDEARDQIAAKENKGEENKEKNKEEEQKTEDIQKQAEEKDGSLTQKESPKQEEEKKVEQKKRDNIVHKPESSNLFKKIFSENQKRTDSSKVKFATVANQAVSPVQDSKTQEEAKGNNLEKKTEGGADNKNFVKQGQKEDNKEKQDQGKDVVEKKQQEIVQKKEEPQPQQPAKKQFSRQVNPPTSNRKKRMDDVRAVPKVMGPLEELQFLDLVNFRRMGKTPEEITAKIFSKIKLLERDGYEKLIAGIKSWKSSPVNKMYLKTIQEAMAKGKTLKELVSSYENNENRLSLAEIEAIVNLNSKLTF